MRLKLLLAFIILIAIIIITAITLNSDYATSAIPGWHTTVYPPFFIAGFFFYWFLVTLLYIVFFRKAFTRKNVIFYLLMTLPSLLLIAFFKYAAGLEGERQMSILILMPVFLFFVVAYFVAQLWVVVKMVRIGIRKIGK